MPFPSISDPAVETVITAAWEIANPLAAVRWLRQLMGNADPPGSSYVVVSSSVSSGIWAKVPSDALAPGVAVANLGYTPANRAGDTFTGPVTVAWGSAIAKGDDGGNGGRLFILPSAGQSGATIDVTNNVLRLFNTTGTTRLLALVLTTGELQVPGQVTLAPLDPTTTGRIMATAPTSAPGYTLDAAGGNFRVFNTGDSTKMLAFNLTTGALTLNGATAITSASIGAQSVAFATNASNATNAGTATLANSVADHIVSWPKLVTTNAPSSGQFLGFNPGSSQMEWQAPAAVAGVPSGLIAAFATASAIPAGWTRYTAADGRFLVGAGAASGTTNTPTFTENLNAGATDWQHAHTVTVAAHTHGSSALGVGGSLGGPSATGGTTSGTPPPSFGTDTHTHSISALDVTGTTDSGGGTSPTTTGVGWVPPSRAVVWAQKS